MAIAMTGVAVGTAAPASANPPCWHHGHGPHWDHGNFGPGPWGQWGDDFDIDFDGEWDGDFDGWR
ncbi:hypothetical protein [Pilimelia anulata]|nr:hypothetical protein [Pilimelia anulata]